ncbi:MAG: hypothetical protein WBN22_01055 [Verrucomicrobiia bacterium]
MRLDTPDSELGRFSREPAALSCTKARLSALGLGGGGGGLGLSGSATTESQTSSGAPVTVYNGSSGPLSSTSWLVIGAIALGALLVIGMIFRGRS